jgi:DnaK suppressor protein
MMAKTLKRAKRVKKTTTARKKVTKKTTKAKSKTKKAAKVTKRTKKTKTVKAKKAVKKPTRKTTKKVVKPRKTTKRKATAKPAKPPVKRAAKTAMGLAVVDIAPYKRKKTEKYMSKKMLEHFRTILITWKQQLMEEVDRTVHHLKGEAANFPDPSDRATQEEVFSLELRTRDRERKLIRKIEEALQMIDNDEYGYCTCCGEEIGLRRLEARPTAKLCIDCKTLDEIREKQEGI